MDAELWRQECRECLGLYFGSGFFVDSEALGGDDVAFFADGFAFSPENESG
jgi:hypothetical protein